MGKKSRMKMAENHGEIVDKKGWFARQKEKVGIKVDTALDNIWQQALKNPRHQQRWMDACGVTSADQIDYTVPLVELESQLCDIRKLKMIKNGKNRDGFLELLSPEARYMYLNACDDQGNRYTDLENPRVLRSMVENIKMKWRAKYGRASPEMEKALDSMIEDDEHADG